MSRGLVIAFEGLMCAGKTTTITRLADSPEVTVVPEVLGEDAIEAQPRFPRAGGHERWIRNDLAKAAAVTRALAAGAALVLVDRYFVSTLAYTLVEHDRDRGPASALTAALDGPTVPSPPPDLWVHLRVDPHTSLARARQQRPLSPDELWSRPRAVARMDRLHAALLAQLAARGQRVQPLWTRDPATATASYWCELRTLLATRAAAQGASPSS